MLSPPPRPPAAPAPSVKRPGCRAPIDADGNDVDLAALFRLFRREEAWMAAAGSAAARREGV